MSEFACNETLFDRVYRNRFGIAALAWTIALLTLFGQWYYHQIYMKQPISNEALIEFGEEVSSSPAARTALLHATMSKGLPDRRQWEMITSYVRSIKESDGAQAGATEAP